MLKIKFVIVFFQVCFVLSLHSQYYISKVWTADLGNGKYKNPVLHADYSDPDVCRVGDDYYMTASSFASVPGLPILHSRDLVNWKLIGHAIERLEPQDVFSSVQHGNGVWAPSIRFHNDEFYIYWGDPDFGIYMVKTKDPAGKWSKAVMVKPGKGLIDPCPLWDEDGRAYVAHAYAGSRAGIKSILAVFEMNAEGTKAITPSRTVYDGHADDPTIEGAKFHKRNGEYYIFAPAGGVATGWQVVMKSKNVYGPYERKVVLAQGKTPINGPHQGAWVDTPEGENWFFHFQDKGAYGRIVHLQPMIWKDNGFPVIGIDKDNDGIGEPVLEYKKPKISGNYPKQTPAESDEFSTNELGLQWQWHANPTEWWSFSDSQKGILTLFSVPIPENYKNLWDVPNLLLQKFPSNKFTTTVKFSFKPDERFVGERAGLLIMGMDYSLLSIEKTKDGFSISQDECISADKGKAEVKNETISVRQSDVFFRVNVGTEAMCSFSYSLDGKKFIRIGKPFKAREGKWIGAKMGVFCSRPISNNDGGRMEIDWFRID
ncbi:MAG: glycosyl hydrolase 43 family protein [Bacteroidia bacterium]|nr:glycosyl hydrolase 43 family protein [Bacteroidia bacterium]